MKAPTIFLDKVIHIIENILILIVFSAMVGMILMEIMFGFFGVHLAWAHEGALYLMVALTCVGASVAVRGEEHIRIDVVVRVLRGRMKKLVASVVFFLCSIICFGAVKVGIDFTAKAYEFGERSAALGLPLWIIYAALPAACVLLGLRFLLKTIDEIYIREVKDNEI